MLIDWRERRIRELIARKREGMAKRAHESVLVMGSYNRKCKGRLFHLLGQCYYRLPSLTL